MRVPAQLFAVTARRGLVRADAIERAGEPRGDGVDLRQRELRLLPSRPRLVAGRRRAGGQARLRQRARRQRRQERRLHPGAGEGRLEALRHRRHAHRRRDVRGRRHRRRRSRFSRSPRSSRWRARSPTPAPRRVEKRIGADATGQPFNSIVALGLNKLQKRPPPGNPLVNAGAIATVDLVAGKDAAERWKHILGTHERVRRPRAHRRREGLQVGDRHQRAQPGHQLDPQGGRGPHRQSRPRSSTSTRGSARSP